MKGGEGGATEGDGGHALRRRIAHAARHLGRVRVRVRVRIRARVRVRGSVRVRVRVMVRVRVRVTLAQALALTSSKPRTPYSEREELHASNCACDTGDVGRCGEI